MSSKDATIPVAIHILLDNSGSMRAWQDPTIDGYNKLIEKLCRAICPPLVSLTTFSETPTRQVDKVPVYEVPRLTTDTFWPCGGTALFASIRLAIKDLDETNAEQKVLVVLTDGGDSTYEYADPKPTAKLIKERLDAGWLVVFLAAGATAMEAAKNLKAPKSHTLNYSAGDMERAMATAADAVMRYATTGSAKEAEFTAEERKLAKV